MSWSPPVGVEEVSRHLLEMLSAYSPSGSEEQAARVFADISSSLGLKTFLDEVGNAWACRGDGVLRVLIAGHIDTVPGELEVARRGFMVYGRGAVDAKGPLLSYLYAVAGLPEPGSKVCVAGLVGEEADSRGAWWLVRSGLRVDHLFISEPTGARRIAIGYRGSMPFRVICRRRGGHAASAGDEDSALEAVIEAWMRVKGCRGSPVSLNATIMRAGSYPNMVPAEAWMHVDARLASGVDVGSLRGCIESNLPRGCRVEYLDYTPPVRVKPQSPVPRSLMRALLRRGVRPRIVVKMGTSDMNILYGRVAGDAAAYGPGDPRLAHGVVEYMDIRELLWASSVEADAISALLERGR